MYHLGEGNSSEKTENFANILIFIIVTKITKKIYTPARYSSKRDLFKKPFDCVDNDKRLVIPTNLFGKTRKMNLAIKS